MIREVSHGPHRKEETRPRSITAVGAGLVSEGSDSQLVRVRLRLRLRLP